MDDKTMHKGSCFCGAVEIEVHGAPVAMGYCHCASCRRWSASPVNAFTLWPPDAVTITQGADELVAFNKTDRSFRKWCKRCGGHVLAVHPGLGVVDVFAGVLDEFAFEPALHVHYGETELPIHDALPRQKDMPKEMGGSGVLVDSGIEAFVAHWIASWNARDAEAILAHFADDVTFRSPKAAAIVGTGMIVGKPALRAYWSAALRRLERLHFTLDHFAWDDRSGELFIVYTAELNADRTRACERLRLVDHVAVEGEALYGAAV